jgi:cyclopropane fatty-acyl-phospholipid synthase-like methyltransferase
VNERSGSDPARYYKKDFWKEENLKYAKPHFRMRKTARVVRKAAGGKECDLLDVGCGPATLSALLPANIRYHGIDIAIQDPAPNLREADFLETPIDFSGRKFDIVVAQGVFEYVGEFQSQKFSEIRELLKEDGTFILTYVNFAHWHTSVYWPYSNTQAPAAFRADLSRFFTITRSFPLSHNWNHSQPNRSVMKVAQAHLNVNIPLLSPRFAVDYLYICSARPD